MEIYSTFQIVLDTYNKRINNTILLVSYNNNFVLTKFRNDVFTVFIKDFYFMNNRDGNVDKNEIEHGDTLSYESSLNGDNLIINVLRNLYYDNILNDTKQILPDNPNHGLVN